MNHPLLALETLFLDFVVAKDHFFGIKVSFIEIDALPLLLPHDHEAEDRGAQAPLGLKSGVPWPLVCNAFRQFPLRRPEGEN
jgi:hypothetical protein